MTTLDDVERTLDSEMVLIADGDGPTSIAGVMGGRRSEVQDDTKRVLLEVATWNGPNINRTMARLQLRSEAGARFEKSLPPETTLWAQAIATTLMVELTGARLAGGTLDIGGAPAEDPVLRLRDARTTSLLGVEVPRERAAEVLQTLGFATADAPDGLDVTVPPFRRGDVTREADLIEEVGRLAALEELPSTLPANRTGLAATLTTRQRLRRRAADALVGRGAHEQVGWSFTTPELGDRLSLPPEDPRRDVVVLENPMSEDHSVLRTTLLGSLLDVAQHNAARGQADLTLFEEGAVYHAGDGRSDGAAPPQDPARARLPREVLALGTLVTGDVFAAKGAPRGGRPGRAGRPRGRAEHRAVPAPGARRASSPGRCARGPTPRRCRPLSAGSARSTRRSPHAGTSGRSARSRSISTRCSSTPPPRRSSRTSRRSRRCARTSASCWTPTSPPRSCGAWSGAPAAGCSSARRSTTGTPGPGSPRASAR